MAKLSSASIRLVQKMNRQNRNGESDVVEPTVDVDRLVFYTCRHSFAQHYLCSPGSTVNGLASLMARSPNTIATYIKQITRNEDIVEAVDNMPI